jgi:hypothetical protein
VPATLIVWFRLRSPELSAEFERMMAGDQDVDLGALDTMSDWRLTRPLEVPGQPSEAPDYVLIVEITEVDRWQSQASPASGGRPRSSRLRSQDAGPGARAVGGFRRRPALTGSQARWGILGQV